MKKIIFAVGLIGLMVASVSAAPQLTLKETEFNFGIAPQNAKVSHTFWIHSTGDEDLNITKVIPGCGCTKAPLEKDVLAPGDSTRLEIIFSTKRYSRHMVKQPRIECNDTKGGYSVTITTDVTTNPRTTGPIQADPYKLSMSQYNNTEREKLSFRLTNVSDKDVKIKVIDTPEDVFKAKIPDEIAAGSSKTAEVVLTDEGKANEWDKSITLECDDEFSTRISIPISRTMKSAEITPASAKVEEAKGK